MRFSDTLPAAFPQWNLEFEDGFDTDFNDFYLRGVAHSPDTLNGFVFTTSAPALHPAIRQVCPLNSRPCQILQDGEEATLSMSLLENGAPAVGKTVAFRAEIVEQSGGHTHYSQRHSLTEFPDLLPDPRLDPAFEGMPPAGYFRSNMTTADSIEVITDSLGIATVTVAGFIGAEVQIIAITDLDTTSVATAAIDIKVPDLVPLEASVTGRSLSTRVRQ